MSEHDIHTLIPYIKTDLPNVKKLTDYLFSLFSLPMSDIETPEIITTNTFLKYIFENCLSSSSEYLDETIRIKLIPMFDNNFEEYKSEILLSNGDYFTINILCPVNIPETKSHINAIYSFLNIFCKLYPDHMSSISTFTLLWLPLDEPKLISDTTKELGTIHMNSGFTQFNTSTPPDIPSIFVIVYRKEDALKVIIHEMFHALKLDGYSSNPNSEVYSEIWALLLYLGWITYNNYDHEDFDLYYSTFINIETAFSRIQSHKISQYKYKKTNAKQYYILKYYLLEHIEEFIEWCQSYNSNMFLFGGEYECNPEFYELCKINEYNTKPFKNVFVEFKNFINTHKKEFISDIPTELKYTMRMLIL
jgi:hypothetical protein